MSKKLNIDIGNAFCVKCGRTTPYEVSVSREVEVIYNARIIFPQVQAKCVKCGEEVYVPHINDTNVDYRLTTIRRYCLEKEVCDDA